MTWDEYKYWFMKSYEKGCYDRIGCGGPILIACLLVVFLLCGCKSIEYVPVETVRTEYITKHDTLVKKDSIHIKDSVFVHAKGDTVWYEKWHTKYVDRWKERIVSDTIIKQDSIRVPYPVERKATRWERFCLDYGKITLGISIAAIIAAIAWLIVWIRRRI